MAARLWRYFSTSGVIALCTGSPKVPGPKRSKGRRCRRPLALLQQKHLWFPAVTISRAAAHQAGASSPGRHPPALPGGDGPAPGTGHVPDPAASQPPNLHLNRQPTWPAGGSISCLRPRVAEPHVPGVHVEGRTELRFGTAVPIREVAVGATLAIRRRPCATSAMVPGLTGRIRATGASGGHCADCPTVEDATALGIRLERAPGAFRTARPRMERITSVHTEGSARSLVTDLVVVTGDPEQASTLAESVLGITGHPIPTLNAGTGFASDALSIEADLAVSTEGEFGSRTTTPAGSVCPITGRPSATPGFRVRTGISPITAALLLVGHTGRATDTHGPRFLATMAETVLGVADQPLATGCAVTIVGPADPLVTDLAKSTAGTVPTPAGASIGITALMGRADESFTSLPADTLSEDTLLALPTGHTVTFAKSVVGIAALPIGASRELTAIGDTGRDRFQHADGAREADLLSVPTVARPCRRVAFAVARTRDAVTGIGDGFGVLGLFVLPTRSCSQRRGQASDRQPAKVSNHRSHPCGTLVV